MAGKFFEGWVEQRRARYYNLTPAGRKQLKQEEVADFERVLEAILRVVQPA